MAASKYRYRSNDGLKLLVEQSALFPDSSRKLYRYDFSLTDSEALSVVHYVEITEQYVKPLGQDPHDADLLHKNSEHACLSIIYDMILQGHLPCDESQTFKLYRDGIDPRIKGTISISSKSGVWIYSKDLSSVIKENQIARRIALESAYVLSSQGGSFDVGKLMEICHYSDHAISNALTYYETAGIIEIHPVHPKIRSLTERGQVEFEKTYLRFSNSVFLIAACQSDILSLTNNVYRPIVEDEFGLKLIFQEEEEPLRSIHQDIYDYIENCKFIIADLTHHRPNCYYELGYALAKEKQILVTINSATDLDKEGKPIIPFDTSPLRYTFYNFKEEPEKFRKELRERINVISGRLGGI
ncbi:MAG: hypothetical protein JSU77_10255 [Fidelibacterota bacterium]|nr:MAG: hypothetical protein JSU77_10255 [Candidatus Neomarinimicrobiota bacterium]